MTLRIAMLACLVLLGGRAASAAIVSQPIAYRDGDTPLEGFLAYDDAGPARRPGVIVVHEWKGLNDYAKGRATQLAQLGYVAFAADIYGKGIVAKDHEEAAKLAGVYRSDRHLMRRRILTALEWLRHHELVDGSRIAAIGYCFGGATVLELARSGADVAGVVSIHGALDTPDPRDASRIQCRVLVLHGADDTFVTPEQVQAFRQEMDAARVRYQVITYPGAVHSFTVPEAGDDPSTGMAYNAEADRQSWNAMTAFLSEVFRSSEVRNIG